MLKYNKECICVRRIDYEKVRSKECVLHLLLLIVLSLVNFNPFGSEF